MINLRVVVISLLCVVLTACGDDDFEGEYVSKTTETEGSKAVEKIFGNLLQQKLVFRLDGKVSVSIGGRQIGVLKYEKDGDEITLLKTDSTTEVFSVEEDGSLLGNGVEYIKSSGKEQEGNLSEKVSGEIIKEDSAGKHNSNIIGKKYVSKPDPDFNPEYAPVIKLFFGSDGKVKLTQRSYDTGAFREDELVLSYKIDDDKVTSIAENGYTLTLTIRKDGSLFDGVKTEFIEL